MSIEKLDEKAIFNIARRIEDHEARGQYLDQVCSDCETRDQINALLSAHVKENCILDEVMPVAIAATLCRSSPVERPGTQIGPYKLLQQIGEGGFGVVYMAEQTEPVRRKVALKIIKPGMDTKEVIARFEAERQVLAMMDHPNIAKVFDAGTTDTGRPYFVMELVHGVPITEFCDEWKLSNRERLQLFIDVCRAVQHAHQKAIIHRDIKPSNIIVTLDGDQPVPKVIDFGVAKALSGNLTDKTVFTAYGQMVGTPLYMSPEQTFMSMHNVDTRSDVYSLGVLLYELLTGTTPFASDTLKSAGLDEFRRIIREEDPPRPSDRVSTLNAELLSTICDHHKADRRNFCRSLRGELDWIVMKALEKDRGRRYESASAFAADLQRYLDDESVLACPPSAGYRFRKFARRHKVSLTVSSLALLSLVGLTVGALSYAVSVQKESQRRIEVNQKISGVIAELHSYEDRAEQGTLDDEGAWFVANQTVDRAQALAKNDLADRELVERVDRVIADFQEAGRDREFVLKLEAIRDEIGGDALAPGLLATGQTVAAPQYGESFRKAGIPPLTMKPVDAVDKINQKPTRIRESITISLWIWAGYVSRVRANLTDIENQQGTWARDVLHRLETDPWRRRLLEAKREDQLLELSRSSELNHQPPHALLVLATRLRFLHGNREEAIAVLKQAHRNYPSDYWINLTLVKNLSDAAEALRYATAAVVLKPNNSQPLLWMGDILAHLGREREAIEAYQRALQLNDRSYLAFEKLGRLYEKQGDIDAAIDSYRRAADSVSLEDGPLRLKSVFENLKLILDKSERTEELALFLEKIADQYPDQVAFLGWLADFHYQHEHWSEVVHWGRAIDAHGSLTAVGRVRLADALVRLDRIEEAKREYRVLAEHQRNWYLPGYTIQELDCKRKSPTSSGNVSPAHLQQAAELLPEDSHVQLVLGCALFKNNQPQHAIERFQRAIRIDPSCFPAFYNLAYALASQEKYDDALDNFRTATELNPECSTLSLYYGRTLQAAGRHEDAVMAFERCFEVAEANYQRFLQAKKAHPEVTSFTIPYPEWYYPEIFANWWAREALEGILLSRLKMNNEQDAVQATRATLLKFSKKSQLVFEKKKSKACLVLGDICKKLALVDPAISAYREAIESDPVPTSGYYSLARLLAEQGRPSGALDLLHKLLELDPDHTSAHKLLKKLKAVNDTTTQVNQRGESSVPRQKTPSEQNVKHSQTLTQEKTKSR